ncbi:coiled-coil domain-containing protein [Streptomyces triticiradicis]|uniref:ATP/GTP-binding protein n=1 Tax=Streptomyces triticiradicis TaxID=2651189 RepID=A0A7J5DGM7_9ACTN|nr:ATP/GTP-binding protein [Streptomyces triticiradicis]KAB1987474.1 ATP/GTP-binding protein [Streptomyces triticiradicis]
MRDGQMPQPAQTAITAVIRPQVSLADLKDDLPPEKRALAEDLRQVFLALGITVRRYAARRYLNASTVTRYLNGDRVPPWDFVAGVIADVQEAQCPLTPEAEEALRDLHRQALKSHRPSSKAQALQDKLAEADDETRRITTRQRALEEALRDRESRLEHVRGRVRNLETSLEGQRLTHRGELEVWQGEYTRLQEECGDLQEQVIYLQESLAVARAELIAAEDRCHRLEIQLETVQELGSDDGGEAPSIMAMLEEADRRSSVPELVRAVSDLELRTRQAMASELVRAASQSRTIEEVVGLLSALRQAGFDAHAQTALPAMVMVRSIDDTSALARELSREGLEDYVLILVQASVKFHQPENMAALATALHRCGLAQHAESLLQAAAVVRPLPDLVSVALTLIDTGLDAAVAAAMALAATRRPLPDLVALSITLRQACLGRYADVLQTQAAAARSAADVAEFISSLTGHGLRSDAEAVFGHTQERSIGHLIPFLHALRDDERAWTVLTRAARSRPTYDIAVLVDELYMSGRHQLATDLLMLIMDRKDPLQIRQLVAAMDGLVPGTEAILGAATRVLAPERTAALLNYLEFCGLQDHATVVFRSMVYDDLVGHAGLFLQSLGTSGSHYARLDVLREHAQGMDAAFAAQLMLALESAALATHLEALIQDRCTNCPVLDIVLLISRITSIGGPVPRSERVTQRIIEHVVEKRPVSDQAKLLPALHAAGLRAWAENLSARADAAHGRQFRAELRGEYRMNDPRDRSRLPGFADRSGRRARRG